MDMGRERGVLSHFQLAELSLCGLEEVSGVMQTKADFSVAIITDTAYFKSY